MTVFPRAISTLDEKKPWFIVFLEGWRRTSGVLGGGRGGYPQGCDSGLEVIDLISSSPSSFKLTSFALQTFSVDVSVDI